MFTYRIDYTESELGYYDDYSQETVHLVRRNEETGEEIYVDLRDVLGRSSWGSDTLRLDISDLPRLFQDKLDLEEQQRVEREKAAELARKESVEQLRKYGERK